MFLKIPKPDGKKIDWKKLQKLIFSDEFRSSEHWKIFLEKQNSPQYKSWEQVQYSPSLPPELNPEESFQLLSIIRGFSAKKTPLTDTNGNPFVWEELNRFRFFCDDFSKNFGVYKSHHTLSKEKQELRRKKIFEGTVEEAIASSQIEGAIITRKQGKELLQSKRAPKTHSEKMVINNYETIVRIETEWKHRNMSEELLLEIQKSLTRGTLENSDQEGRFRTKKDHIVVGNPLSNETAFIPPEEKQMRKQLLRCIDFTNDTLKCDEYFGDLPSAILIHFWLAYLHPFCDGNGRTARALFYWYLLRKNYLSIGFLPISNRIRASKRQYENAFLLAEQDQNNLTYFFDYIIRQMRLSVKDFEQYEMKATEEEQKRRQIAEKHHDLSGRQIELLRYFAKKSDKFTTFKRHQLYHNISYITARKDLIDLEIRKLLISQKRKKDVVFFPTKKVRDFL